MFQFVARKYSKRREKGGNFFDSKYGLEVYPRCECVCVKFYEKKNNVRQFRSCGLGNSLRGLNYKIKCYYNEIRFSRDIKKEMQKDPARIIIQ